MPAEKDLKPEQDAGKNVEVLCAGKSELGGYFVIKPIPKEAVAIPDANIDLRQLTYRSCLECVDQFIIYCMGWCKGLQQRESNAINIPFYTSSPDSVNACSKKKGIR